MPSARQPLFSTYCVQRSSSQRVIAVLLALFVCVSRLTAGEVSEKVSFERDIRPILKAHCFHCHGEEAELRGGLDLRRVKTMVRGGDTGPAIVPGDVAGSLLLQRIEAGEMPPKGKLTAPEFDRLRAWIQAGATTERPEPETPIDPDGVSEDERAYWAFQPVRRPPLPVMPDPLESAVDAFLLAKLTAHNLGFSPPVERRILIRRATLDLLGLPPSPQEIDDFAADELPDAYDRLLDRLLASPHYGERWGRHWLDVAGYADSEGYSETDPVRPYAYKYRDYVIRSLNADKPYDAFLTEQLAGDELVPQPYGNMTEAQIELLSATGFLRMVPDGTATGAPPKEAGNAVVADVIKTVSTGILGLTVGCAQCHNHRYDPIPQVDYYRLRAIFEPAYNVAAWRKPAQRLVSLYTQADRDQAAVIEAQAKEREEARRQKQEQYIQQTFEKELAKLPEERRETVRQARQTAANERTPEQKQLLKEFPSVNVDAGSLYLYDAAAANDLKKDAEEIAKLRATKPVEDFISCLSEVPGASPETRLFERGDPDQAKQVVAPGELSVLASYQAASIPLRNESLPSSGRRLAYARHLVSGNHPLTGRVLVNRIWMHHFGRGIVATAGDFGKLGDSPTHPELLDWLAAELVDQGWHWKALHRRMMLSRAYQQSPVRSKELDDVDPDNRLLGRMTVRRLDAETLRDSVLAVSGELVNKQFGPAAPVMEDDVGQIVIGIENKNGENRPGPIIPMHGEDLRRSIYVQVRRTRPLGVLDTFDAPVMEPNCTMRASSTVASQSLLLMNSEFLLQQSRQLAARLRREAGEDLAMQVHLGWRLVFGRSPSDAEAASAVAFLQEQVETLRPVSEREPNAAKRFDPQVWALGTLTQAWLSSNEFLYLD